MGEDDNGSIREPMSGLSRAAKSATEAERLAPAYGLPVRLTETISVPGSTLCVDASVALHDCIDDYFVVAWRTVLRASNGDVR